MATVFRAAVLSIVLALATGTNAVLYCALSCHPVEETAGGCEHGTGPTTAPRRVAAADCAIAGNAIPFVREDARRRTPASHVQDAVVTARFALPPSPVLTLRACGPARRPLLDLRPLDLALRI